MKQEFISAFESALIDNGFEKKEICDTPVYERVKQARLPGQIISINGQTMEQPGQIVEVKTVVLEYRRNQASMLHRILL